MRFHNSAGTPQRATLHRPFLLPRRPRWRRSQVNGEESDRHGFGGRGGGDGAGPAAEEDAVDLDLQTMKKFVTYCRR